METKILSLLKEYGLDEKEIKIYLFLVGNVELSAYQIAKKTNIHRSTTYDVLERLINKGFVNKIERDSKIFYSGLELNQVIAKIKDKENILVSLIPEIEKIKTKEESKVRILESVSGQKQFNYNLFNLIKQGKIKEIFVIGLGPAQHESSQLFLEALIKESKRKKLHKKINFKGIWDKKFRNSKMAKIFSNIGENRFIDKLPTKVTNVIYGDYVAYLFTLDEIPQVIEIKNKLIAEENKTYFGYLWKLAK